MAPTSRRISPPGVHAEIRDSELLWIDVQAPTDDERTWSHRRCRSRPKHSRPSPTGAATPDGHVLDEGMLVTVQTLREDVTESPIVLHILIGQDGPSRGIPNRSRSSMSTTSESRISVRSVA